MKIERAKQKKIILNRVAAPQKISKISMPSKEMAKRNGKILFN